MDLACQTILLLWVAPFTGAWIEISSSISISPDSNVAPFTGAWIEIQKDTMTTTGEVMSHPSRVRGLKSPEKNFDVWGLEVAPFTGAWIEIQLVHRRMHLMHRRTLHGCVD